MKEKQFKSKYRGYGRLIRGHESHYHRRSSTVLFVSGACAGWELEMQSLGAAVRVREMRRQHAAKAPLLMSLLDRADDSDRAAQLHRIDRDCEDPQKSGGKRGTSSDSSYSRGMLCMQWSAQRWDIIRARPWCSALVGAIAPGFQRIDARRSLKISDDLHSLPTLLRFLFRAHSASEAI
jgi:hypothetical protein